MLVTIRCREMETRNVNTVRPSAREGHNVNESNMTCETDKEKKKRAMKVVKVVKSLRQVASPNTAR